MPELKCCVYCKKPIKRDQDFVSVELAAQDSRKFGEPVYEQHAHAECAERMNELDPD